LFCLPTILNEHFGVVHNCEYILECVHRVHACSTIVMRWIILRKSLTMFHSPGRKCNSQCTQYTQHSKLPNLFGYWESIARSVRLLVYY
jgi:hypothetical protein